MKPRLRIESVGPRVIGNLLEGREKVLEILDVCSGRPISINSVLDELRVRRLKVYNFSFRQHTKTDKFHIF